MPPEFRLAVECCRWSFYPGRADAVRALGRDVDWDAFLVTADRHRVGGLAWNALRSVGAAMPDGIRSALSDRANLIAIHGLQSAVASAGLSKALDESRIPHLFVKGLAVGALAYGAPFLKQSWDIDVLIGEDGVLQGAEVLQRLGYELIFPRMELGRLPRWHEVQKDSAWRHSTSGIIVELHGRLADNRRLIPTIGLNSPRQAVAITPEISLPTLANEEMFAHLCVHGASSAWFRLKWISDLTALLSRWSGDVDRLYRQSQQLEAGRSAGQALLLAYRLFEIELPSELRQSLESDRSTRWLSEIALDQLLAPEPGDRRFGTAMIHASQLRLLPDLAFKAGEARRQVAAAISNLLD
jgi:hypothetical protein